MRPEQWQKAMDVADALHERIMAETNGVGIPNGVIEEVLREAKAD